MLLFSPVLFLLQYERQVKISAMKKVLQYSMQCQNVSDDKLQQAYCISSGGEEKLIS